jgi:ribA/ribD-fused uncharacterized protein
MANSKKVQRRHSSGKTSLAKLFFQILQCLHHQAICNAQSEGNVTKAFRSKLKDLNQFLKPAQETTHLRENILATNWQWMTLMTSILLDHYSSRISELLGQIKSSKLNLESFEQNTSIAIEWAKRNFGKKIKPATIQDFRKLISSIRPGQTNSLPPVESRPQQPQVGKAKFTGKGKLPDPQAKPAATTKPPTPQNTHKPLTGQDWTSGWDHVKMIRRVRGPKDPLSNFFPCSINFRGQNFKSVEHAYHWDKAVQHDCYSTADKIMLAPTALDAKRIASKEIVVAPTWESYKLDLMLDLLIHKGQQNQAFFNELVQSVGYTLIHPVKDSFWGCGLQGNGNDHFSKLLVKARTILTSDPQPPSSHTVTPQNTSLQQAKVSTWNESHDTSLYQTQVSDVVSPATSLHEAQVDPTGSPAPPTPPPHTPTDTQSLWSPTPTRGWEVTPPLNRQPNFIHDTPARGTRSQVRRNLTKPNTHTQCTGILNRHSKVKKTCWALTKVDKPILIIGDSNLSNIQAPNSNVQIESFPGGNFYNIRTMLQRTLKSKINTTLAQHIIISVGINDRNNKPHSTSIPELRKVIHSAKELFQNATVHIAQINFSTELSDLHKTNLRTLNDYISKLSLCENLKRLPHSKFRVVDDNIHWTYKTANAILEHWLNLLPNF